MSHIFYNFLKDEEGAAMAEYGILVGLIAVVVIVAVTTLGTDIKAIFDSVSTAFGTAGI